jgi:beta-galactosidase
MDSTLKLFKTIVVLALSCLAGCSSFQPEAAKTGATRIINLDGRWQIAEGSMDSVPSEFAATVRVPGLVDMAEPAFDEVGKKSDRRQAFWYRRTFKVRGQIPDVAILKIHKAKYGTKVLLNGEVVGEHLPCFTPALLDVKKLLRGYGEENELIVRVGADRESVPAGQPAGWDFEKYLYIPGIYDSVELIVTGEPYLVNVQTVPDISAGNVRVVTEVHWPAEGAEGPVSYEVHEAKTGRLVGAVQVVDIESIPNQTTKLDVTVPIENCRLWSPEDPFLYELKVDSGGDTLRTRFAMRSFGFDKDSGRAILNGKPYLMRGTNVCAYRFFEDDQRGDKPWRKDWVRRLHRKFKGMHWNSIRYCIGFPPELWYEIADEEGFLIQDEFPIWLLGDAPEKPQAEKIIPEYTEWMRERWNHACVVIWDAQNESVTDQTGKALQAVRGLDLSNRPWENGWAEPQSPTDFVESHPYLFIRAWSGQKPFRFEDIAGVSGVPYLRGAQKKYDVPIVINEYGWLWLNRDGTVTCLTDKVYESLLGPNSTARQRRVLYAKYLAALTEFWRCRRECAGVLHFCGLGYSRPGDKPRPEGGATSDHFVDLERLEFEPNFEKYVRDAFSPVGLMIDYWGQEITASTKRQFEVVVINDLDIRWTGTVRFEILQNKRTLVQQRKECSLKPYGKDVLTFELDVPEQAGEYELVAGLPGAGGRLVRSRRDAKIVRSE